MTQRSRRELEDAGRLWFTRAMASPWASELIAAMLGSIRAARPESIAGLADGFTPTEEVPSAPPRSNT